MTGALILGCIAFDIVVDNLLVLIIDILESGVKGLSGRKKASKNIPDINTSARGISTCGYSERYGGGYSAGSYIAPEIRDAATYLSDDMKQRAKKMGIRLTQKGGHLNFGAGVQIQMNDYVVTVPTAFEWKKDYQNCEVVAYSRDCSDDIFSSPLVLQIEGENLVDSLTENEFELRQKSAAEVIGGTFEIVKLDRLKAVMITDKNYGARILKRLSVLRNNGSKIFTFNLIFLKNICNIDEITKRIYFSICFSQ